MYTPLNSRTPCIEIIEKTQNVNAKKTIKISRNFTNIQCHAILIFYSVRISVVCKNFWYYHRRPNLTLCY